MNDPQRNDITGLPAALRAALDDEPARERDALLQVWALAEHARADEPSDASFAHLGASIWPNLEAAIRQETPSPLRLVPPAPSREDRQPARRPLHLVQVRALPALALAACIALLIAVGVSLWQQPVSVTAPAGEIAQVLLPDGSTAALNSGSTLEYTRRFDGQARLVRLEGEAFFDVQKGDTPFQVRTFNGTTTVLGTRFNVRAWSDGPNPSTDVLVEEGVVRVTALGDATRQVVLKAGEAATLDEALAPVAFSPNAEHVLAWRDGGFKFTGEPLGDILLEVERRYDVRITAEPEMLDDPVDILIERTESAEQLVRDLCEYNGYRYRPTDNGFAIYRP